MKGSYETVYFKYEVVIEQPPTVKEAPPRHLIVSQGNMAQISAEFDGRLTSRVSLKTLFIALYGWDFMTTIT